jgi:hypothetical protein
MLLADDNDQMKVRFKGGSACPQDDAKQVARKRAFAFNNALGTIPSPFGRQATPMGFILDALAGSVTRSTSK